MEGTSSRSRFIAPGLEDVPINQWWIAAARPEIGRSILSRKILGRTVALYRTEAGEVVALPDRCPHRLMPLSQGRLIGDTIQCGYHGFEFAPDGRCTLVPSQDKVPNRLRVEPYPVLERGLWIWIWMGDPELAEPAAIPHVEQEKPGYHETFHFCMPVPCYYLRLHENLLDSTHPSFLHEGMVDDGELAQAPQTVEVNGPVVRVIRQTEVHEPSEGTIGAFGLPRGKRIVRTTISESHAPAINTVINRFTFPDEPHLPPHELITPLAVTPADSKLCYQFWWSVSSYPPVDPDLQTQLFSEVMKQDIAALEGIEERLSEGDPEAIEISIRADEASMRFRRIVTELAAAERQARA